MTDKEKARRDFLYRTKWLPAYLAFIVWYPFHLEDLEGEVWRWIRGYEGLYQISNYGRLKSFPRKGTGKEIKILRPKLKKNGYLEISLRKKGVRKSYSIHRLVAEAFIPNPENKPHVNHKDGNKFDNYFENLEWVTQLENMEHAKNTGLIKSGVENPNAKLTEEQVHQIRENYIPFDKELGIHALARKFNMSVLNMFKIINGKTYKNID